MDLPEAIRKLGMKIVITDETEHGEMVLMPSVPAPESDPEALETWKRGIGRIINAS